MLVIGLFFLVFILLGVLGNEETPQPGQGAERSAGATTASHAPTQPANATSLPAAPLHPVLNGFYDANTDMSRATSPSGDLDDWDHTDTHLQLQFVGSCTQDSCMQQMLRTGTPPVNFTWQDGSWVGEPMFIAEDNGATLQGVYTFTYAANGKWTGTTDNKITATVPGGLPVGSEEIVPLAQHDSEQ